MRTEPLMQKSIFIIILATTSLQTYVFAEPSIEWGITISSGNAPPPAVRYEPLPPPRPSHVWVRGYWAWDGNDYRWVAGHWEPARVGYVYVQPEWIQSPRGWEFRRGGWEGDEGRERGESRRDGRCPPGHRKKGEC